MNPIFIIVDLFCGAGGTTSGFENNKYCKVIACVNHDENATIGNSVHPLIPDVMAIALANKLQENIKIA